MNDPNGLSKIRGRYHVFFQYAPESADGRGMHGWGLYTSPDLLVWTYEGMKIYPDAPFDEDGAYSGSVVRREKDSGSIIRETSSIRTRRMTIFRTAGNPTPS